MIIFAFLMIRPFLWIYFYLNIGYIISLMSISIIWLILYMYCLYIYTHFLHHFKSCSNNIPNFQIIYYFNLVHNLISIYHLWTVIFFYKLIYYFIIRQSLLFLSFFSLLYQFPSFFHLFFFFLNFICFYLFLLIFSSFFI